MGAQLWVLNYNHGSERVEVGLRRVERCYLCRAYARAYGLGKLTWKLGLHRGLYGKWPQSKFQIPSRIVVQGLRFWCMKWTYMLVSI